MTTAAGPVAVAVAAGALLAAGAAAAVHAACTAPFEFPPNGVNQKRNPRTGERYRSFVVGLHFWGALYFWSTDTQEKALRTFDSLACRRILFRLHRDGEPPSLRNGTERPWEELRHGGANSCVDEEIRGALHSLLA